MNIQRLGQIEKLFFSVYPEGFSSPEMGDVRKRHPIMKMHDLAVEELAEDKFDDYHAVLETIIKLVTRSSMLSIFEKPKFRDYVRELSDADKKFLAESYRDLLYGHPDIGFQAIIDILVGGALAKWSVISIVPFYYAPQKELFVKPSVTKKVIDFFELEGIQYKPRPSYGFYIDYKKCIDEMMRLSDEKTKFNYAAFTGFLMVGMGLYERERELEEGIEE